MRFKVVGFSYQTQILQKSVPEHRTPPQICFECAPLTIIMHNILLETTVYSSFTVCVKININYIVSEKDFVIVFV
jgi:hypothetical protein